MKEVRKLKSLIEFHRSRGLPPPLHPLISVVDYAQLIALRRADRPLSTVADFYSIAVKRGLGEKMLYGQQSYDFDEGVMYFLAPGQVLQTGATVSAEASPSGWILLIHPDFIWNTTLAKTIRQYEYFDYSVNEALFLSEKEEAILNNIVVNITQEYHSNIDQYSQGIIISQIETLLNYAERFYQRQFITRKKTNHQVLARLEQFLDDYFKRDITTQGLPSVQFVAEALHVSPGYLSSLLKVLTGHSTQHHIHLKLIEKAKEQLSTTDLSIS
ncbi:MAG: AraC family transcriptional regulator, partial [Pedobacter sp.]